MPGARFANKVAFITGANRGIGRGCALALAAGGAAVAISYRRHVAEAEALAGEICRAGGQAITLQGDVSDRRSVEETIRSTVDRFGSLDILVANAAATVRRPFLDLTVDDMQFTLDVTLWGVFHCSQVAARQMVSQGTGGNIVLMSSVHAALPFKDSLPYDTAKAAISHMGRSMANELARYRIRVNVVEPGWIDTPGEHELASDEELQAAGERLPLCRLGNIEDVAQGVAYLVSNDAAYVTGSILRIDGGLCLAPPGI
jgi:glucose 1-dehydrogenase